MKIIDRDVEVFGDRAEWLAARRKGVGSSDAPAILGLSRYSSPLSLYHEKRGVVVEDDRGEEMRQIGLALEPVIAQLFAQETGRQVFEPAPNSVIHSSVFPWMLASLDRWQVDPKRPVDDLDGPEEITQRMRGVLELKNVSVYQASNWLDDGEIPLEYLVQVQHQLNVTGAEYASIAAIIGGTAFKWADVPRDDELIGLIQEKEIEFWARVLDGRPPEADGHEATRKTLRALAGELEPKIVSAPTEFLALDSARVELQAQQKVIDARLEEIQNQLCAHLVAENANTLMLPNGVNYTWKLQRREGYTVKATEFPVLRRKAPKGL